MALMVQWGLREGLGKQGQGREAHLSSSLGKDAGGLLVSIESPQGSLVVDCRQRGHRAQAALRDPGTLGCVLD